MGVFDKVLITGVAALIGNGIVQTYRSVQETKRRKNTPLRFDGNLTQQDFTDAAGRIAKKTPRVAGIEVTGMTVLVEVRSNSGLSTWTAEIDFNDYGRLTGNHWLTSENTQSPIPEFFGRALQEEIWKIAS
ncbi:hypothetical protein LFT45_05985 [Arthrobacter sp. FW305-BF8]|uniref:hypothetical protein n=1 Tax=Arthrobacter sp. FW305-BF8 TaxID=2879617 RepID=UPI001F35A1DE|nr:hypothetical protein [Arthrobacter sp. FW305-BF8]UKA55471.1 hypothetical protein LFT45_05985 [Arthrobacter sp. FW305-BF8]